jgi:SAM-dependent methyltransferase
MDGYPLSEKGMNPAEFGNIARAEDDLWWYRGQRDILTELIDRWFAFKAIDDVLEAGCGTGHTAKFLVDRYGWRVTALDLSAIGLDHARHRGLLRLVQSDITQLPFRSGVFDALISLDVVAHLDSSSSMLAFREFSRIVRPGGLLVLRTAALECLRSRHSEYILERQRFTRSRLISQIEQAGCRVLYASYLNALLSPVAWLKFRIWEPLLSTPPASGVGPTAAWLNNLLSLPLAIEAQWIKRGGSLPIGQTLLVVAKVRQ